MPFRVVTVKMPDDMIEEIDRIAKATGRSRSATIRLLLRIALMAIKAAAEDACSARPGPRKVVLES